jgi:hypothetical protein
MEKGPEGNAVVHKLSSHVFDVTASTQTHGNKERNASMFLWCGRELLYVAVRKR